MDTNCDFKSFIDNEGKEVMKKLTSIVKHLILCAGLVAFGIGSTFAQEKEQPEPKSAASKEEKREELKEKLMKRKEKLDQVKSTTPSVMPNSKKSRNDSAPVTRSSERAAPRVDEKK